HADRDEEEAAREATEETDDRRQPTRRAEQPRLEHTDRVPHDRVRQRVEPDGRLEEQVVAEAREEARDRAELRAFLVADREREEQSEVGHHAEQSQVRKHGYLDDDDQYRERDDAEESVHRVIHHSTSKWSNRGTWSSSTSNRGSSSWSSSLSSCATPD